MANSAAGRASDYNTEIINEFRANHGRVGGPWAGTTLILIHHIGARSGSSGSRRWPAPPRERAGDTGPSGGTRGRPLSARHGGRQPGTRAAHNNPGRSGQPAGLAASPLKTARRGQARPLPCHRQPAGLRSAFNADCCREIWINQP
jgi:hypothetical protein